ncbi:MAG: DUF3732 domain-containing protein [Chitinophagaceae bacterium]|nr:MAG: DUF3732 domain-containing protein [Chitinophagaceae bacterium]
MQIEKIVLYNGKGDQRIIEFKLGKVNIITGESKSGKSALIEIVEYCLASSGCDIAEGIIRETVQYFSVIVIFKDGERAFIARENPNRKRVSAVSTVCLIRNIGSNIPALEQISSNMDIDALKDFLSRKIGISENVHVPDNLTRNALKANFKHSRFYCYQPQYLVADPHQLFYNQNKEFVPQAIKDTLPYFLGAVGEHSLVIESEINQLKRHLNRINRERREYDKIKSEGISQANSLIEEAKEIGILEKDVSIQNQADVYRLLETIVNWDYKPLEVAPEDSGLKSLIDRRNDLREELGKISDNRKSALDYLKHSFGYSSEAKQQEIRLECIKLYDSEIQPDQHTCPLCMSSLEVPIPIIENINEALTSIKDDLEHTAIESPRIQSYIETINNQFSSIESDLASVEKSITSLYIQNEKAKTIRDLNIRRGKVIGRVSLFLESIKSDSEIVTFDNQTLELQSKIHALESQIDFGNEEEALLSILNKVNLQMSRWVSQLDVEYEDSPIRFDINKLTLFIDSDIKPIALSQIGSGANWVAYHLLIMFALHKHFIQNNRPVPNFLMVDQPTQVYYPPEKNEGLVEISSDEIAVNKMFDFMFDVAEQLYPNFQVIVTDHAFLLNDRFRDSVIDIWRDGNKLIPAHWTINS